nr:hypothetical protein [Nitrospiraceae bacterium]
LINAGKIGGISIVLPPFQLGQAIIMGGPDLPIAGGSVFYFLFDLILLYILAYGYYRLKDTIRRPLGLLVIIISMVYFQYCIFSRRAVAFWRLENFLIYVPIAYFLRFSDGFPKLKNFFLLGFIIFSVEESMVALRMHFLGYGVLYDRVSIAIGATAITSVILEASKLAANEKKSDFIRLLSVYSLGIFALHKYWVLLVNLMFLELFINGFSNQSVNVQIFNLNLDALQLIKVAAEVAFTLLSVYLLGRTPLKKYVS